MSSMTRPICASAVLALLAVTMSGTADAPPAANSSSSPAAANHSIGRKLKLAGVSNFGEVSPTLYRGAQPTKEGFDALAKRGINIVVDLRGSRQSEREQVTKLGMQYVPIPWRCFHPEDEIFARFLSLLRENPGKKVFVHCRVGDDRTGMMIAAYRMAEQGWTPEEARKEMEAYGVGWFHRMICPGLSSYEASFPERFRTRPAFQSLRPPDPSGPRQP